MTKFQKRYYNFFTKLYQYERRIKLRPVDFDKPWWTILWQQKGLFLLMLSAVASYSFYDSIMPLWIAKTVESGSISNLGLVIFGRIILALVMIAFFSYNPIFQLGTVNSILYSANQKTLESDPISHSTKSSGVIISKINKGSGAYEDILDVLTFEFFGMFIGIVTTIWVLMSYNFKIGLVASALILLMSAISVITTIFNNKLLKPLRIKAEDQVSQTSVETLQQASYIRSVFGSQEQLQALRGNISKYVGVEGTSWRVDSSAFVVILVTFFVSVFIVAAMVMSEIQQGNISSVVGIGLITSYISSSNSIKGVGNQVKKLSSAHSRITDLFTFMRGFGQQTFPVLDEKQILK
jgi:hypothetical protein